MRVLGIAVSVETESRPTARALLVDDVSGAPAIVENFELPGDDVDFPEQLRDLFKSCTSRLLALSPDRVAVRRADFPPTGSRKEAPKLRLMAEGVITAAAREHVAATYLGTGQEIGAWVGTDKDAVKADAKALVKTAGLPVTKWTEAAVAALGALSKN